MAALLLLACSNHPETAKAPIPPPAPEPVAQTVAETPEPTPARQPEAAPARQPEPAPARQPEVPPRPAPASPAPAPPADNAPPAPPLNLHASWDDLLQKHVAPSGKVHYKGFRTDKDKLDAYLQALSDNPPADAWSRAEKMAYWINAYNAFTIDLIADNYPVSSIMHLDGGKTWDVKRIELGGKKYSLNQIEHEILRPQYQDARIHFAVNCAAKSCPPLLNRAYTPENLTRTLEQRTRQFINDPKYNTLAADKAEVSKIFEWYAADFGDLRAYLNKYAAVPLSAEAKIGFAEYDWGLNE